jgi:hypothetical protein
MMKKTAIILFAHLPDFEARVKSFSGFSSKKATQKVSRVLTQHFYQLTKQTTADSFLIDSYHQKGKSFGERITNAFADVYAKGYENVICIGNDCPELDLTQLQTAVNTVEKGNIVLGPTIDGGSYLMGIPKSEFNKKDFIGVKWQSSKTYQNLLKSFDQSLITELQILSDIDSEKDLDKYQNRNKLVSILIHLIAQFNYRLLSSKSCIYIPQTIFRNNLFRGPPTPASSF